MDVNDNDPPSPHPFWSSPDPHAQAAMLLAESMLHGLVEKGVISVGDAVEIVESAAKVKSEIAAELGDTPQDNKKSLVLLTAIANSLRSDLDDR